MHGMDVGRGERLAADAPVAFLEFVDPNPGDFPEGFAFAVLLMNACVPIIDRFTRPRIYGHGVGEGRGVQ